MIWELLSSFPLNICWNWLQKIYMAFLFYFLLSIVLTRKIPFTPNSNWIFPLSDSLLSWLLINTHNVFRFSALFISYSLPYHQLLLERCRCNHPNLHFISVIGNNWNIFHTIMFNSWRCELALQFLVPIENA